MTDAASSPKKKAAPKKPAEHPKYIDMIIAAIGALKERTGSSRQAILKYILSNYKIGNEDSAKTHLKQALKRGVASGKLVHAKGTGASGSFKLSAAAKKPAAPKKTPKKKPAAAKKKPAAKKPASKKAAKKPAAKKTTTKKTPKKSSTKKPAAKKTKKPAAKKPAAKKAGKKSSPKKKAASKKASKK